MYLVFDTETNTFPRWNSPPSDPNQARIVQIAMLLLDDAFNEKASFKSLVCPSGAKWTMSDGAQQAHGISESDCYAYGISTKSAMQIFAEMSEKCELVICHNVKFDTFMIDIECAQVDMLFRFDWHNSSFCTMESSTPICKMPKTSNRGPNEYKWPKLSEAYEILIGKPLEGAHDAMVDVRATAAIFRFLKMHHSLVSQD